MSTFDLACGLKYGDNFFEDVDGCQMRFVVSTCPTVLKENGYTKVQWEAISTNNSAPTNFLITKGLEHYGPVIYKE